MEAKEPYLPPREPSDNPPAAPAKKAGVTKTLLLWVLLIVMFIVIYQFFNSPSTTHHVSAHQETASGGGSSWIYGWLPGGAVVGMFFFFFYRLRGGNQLNQKLEPGMMALADGDLGRALAVFDQAAKEYRKQAHYVALIATWQASVRLRQGAFSDAADNLIGAERTAGLLYGSDVRASAAVDLAHLYGLRGQLDAAGRWIADGRRRLPKVGHRLGLAAKLRVAEALVAARRGEREQAARLLDGDWHRIESAFTVSLMREVWLLRAFVADGGQRGSAETWLTLLRASRGELDWIGAEWPEMKTFLVAHGLSARPSA
jgi:hypothetical protein